MEKKQYQGYYAPYAPARLVKSSELLENALESAGDYNNLDINQRILMLVFSKILQTGENLIGPLFSPVGGNPAHSLSARWFPVVNYFKEKKLFDDIIFKPLYHDEPKVIRGAIISSAVHERLSEISDGRTPKSGYTHGDSFDYDEAVAKAIGEFLERYPLLIYREKDFLRASIDDLRKNGELHLDIYDLANFSEWQKSTKKRFQFNEKSNFLWAQGKLLFDNKTCLIPAQLIFWNYVTNHQNWLEPVLRESNTNGAAGHYSLVKAILSGLYELIQRDGFLIYWLNSAAPPQVDLETIGYEPLRRLIQDCQRLNFEIHFYNTTTDIGVPSCVCTVFDHSGVGPKVSMGGGCEMSWDKMLFRSLTEATGVYHWLRERKDNGQAYPSLSQKCKPFQDNSIGQLERLDIWGNGKTFDQFEFFLRGKMQSLEELKKKFPGFSSPEEELNYLIGKFKSMGKGYEIFYYQANHEALKDLGYFSVKVVVPALVPLYLREILAPLGAKRIKEVPGKLGFEAAEEFNPLPHPFP